MDARESDHKGSRCPVLTTEPFVATAGLTYIRNDSEACVRTKRVLALLMGGTLLLGACSQVRVHRGPIAAANDGVVLAPGLTELIAAAFLIADQ